MRLYHLGLFMILGFTSPSLVAAPGAEKMFLRRWNELMGPNTPPVVKQFAESLGGKSFSRPLILEANQTTGEIVRTLAHEDLSLNSTDTTWLSEFQEFEHRGYTASAPSVDRIVLASGRQIAFIRVTDLNELLTANPVEDLRALHGKKVKPVFLVGQSSVQKLLAKNILQRVYSALALDYDPLLENEHRKWNELTKRVVQNHGSENLAAEDLSNLIAKLSKSRGGFSIHRWDRGPFDHVMREFKSFERENPHVGFRIEALDDSGIVPSALDTENADGHPDGESLKRKLDGVLNTGRYIPGTSTGISLLFIDPETFARPDGKYEQVAIEAIEHLRAYSALNPAHDIRVVITTGSRPSPLAVAATANDQIAAQTDSKLDCEDVLAEAD